MGKNEFDLLAHLPELEVLKYLPIFPFRPGCTPCTLSICSGWYHLITQQCASVYPDKRVEIGSLSTTLIRWIYTPLSPPLQL